MGSEHSYDKWLLSLVVWLTFSLAGCQATLPPASPNPGTQTVPPALTPIPSQTVDIETHISPTSAAITSTLMVSGSVSTPAPTPVFYEPAGCWQPPDDYSRIAVNNHTLNTRTYAMLQQAASLYGGEIDIVGSAII